jgi:penicillin-binding protein 1A
MPVSTIGEQAEIWDRWCRWNLEKRKTAICIGLISSLERGRETTYGAPMAKRSGRRRRRVKKPSWFRRLLLRLVVFGGGAIALVILFYGVWASLFDLRQVGVMPQRSIVYDMDAKEYGRLHGENRLVVPLEKVSKHFINALLAREDSRFYKHPGIDPIGILRAIVRNATSLSVREGASTLTQQLARNSYQLTDRSLSRKLLEAMLALRMEAALSKDEILEHYINRIYFGSGVYGLETASRLYFDKPCSQLTLSEAATLAGIIRSPNRFSPLRNPEGAVKERNVVLNRMRELKMISDAEAQAASESKLRVAKVRKLGFQENYAMDMVRRELDLILADTQVEEGGLRIYTTIDPVLQSNATKALEAHLQKIEKRQGYKHPVRASFKVPDDGSEPQPPYLQGAAVVIDNRTGGIRALLGGRDYAESKFNRALLAERQVGSAFKPFVYACAFENGLLPGTFVDDGPIRPGEIPTAPNWRPGNSDQTFGGPEPASTGLIRSRNTMSIRVGEMAGLGRVREIATRIGIARQLPPGPSIYLGTFESTLRELTAAYTIFPNSGIKKQSYIIERIDSPSGTPIYRASHLQAQLMDPSVAWLASSVLEEVIRRGTGASARANGFKVPAAGKTGTTDNYKDAWFVGYTSTLTCGVWVGLDQPKPIMPRGYGSTLALPIWTAIMQQADRDRYPAEEFKPPVPLESHAVCAVSSLLATRGCRNARTAYDIELPVNLVPRQACRLHRGAVVDRARQPREEGFGDRVIDSLRGLFRR